MPLFDYTGQLADGSSAEVLAVTNATTLTLKNTGLSGGTEDDFDLGDRYRILRGATFSVGGSIAADFSVGISTELVPKPFLVPGGTLSFALLLFPSIGLVRSIAVAQAVLLLALNYLFVYVGWTRKPNCSK